MGSEGMEGKREQKLQSQESENVQEEIVTGCKKLEAKACKHIGEERDGL